MVFANAHVQIREKQADHVAEGFETRQVDLEDFVVGAATPWRLRLRL